jgi:hypothetical protein
MCGSLSEGAARLNAEAELQHYQLVGVLGQRKQGCIKSFGSVFLFLVRRTVIAETGILHNNTNSKCPALHNVKRGKGMHPKQNERGSNSSGPIL